MILVPVTLLRPSTVIEVKVVGRGRALWALVWTKGRSHCDELQENLRGNREPRVALDEIDHLRFLLARHEFHGVMVAREGPQNVHERVSWNDGFSIVIGM